MSTATDAAIAAEIALLDPRIRSDRAAVDALLHPDFIEIGASGRVWTRADLIQQISDFDSSREAGVVAIDLTARELARGVVLVQYDTDHDGPVHRTSLWLQTDGAWLVVHHQGTPALR